MSRAAAQVNYWVNMNTSIHISKKKALFCSMFFVSVLTVKLLPNAWPLFMVLYSALLFFVFLVSSTRVLNSSIALYFITILSFGLIGGLGQASAHNYIRDVAHFIFPVVVIVFFYKATRLLFSGELKPLFIALSLALLCVFYVKFSTTFVGFSKDEFDLSLRVGISSFVSFVAALISAEWFLGIKRPSLIEFCILVLYLVALALSFSRTEVLTFFVLLITFVFSRGFRFKYILVSTFFFAILVVGFLVAGVGDVFLEKISRSGSEILTSDFDGASDVHTFWRAYESLRVLLAFVSEPLVRQIFGAGFGALVDLGLNIKLGEYEYTHISVFHNGYLWILFKTGVFGLLVFCSIQYREIKICRRDLKNMPRQLRWAPASGRLGILLALGLSTFFISGWLNPNSGFPLFALYGVMCGANRKGGVSSYG